MKRVITILSIAFVMCGCATIYHQLTPENPGFTGLRVFQTLRVQELFTDCLARHTSDAYDEQGVCYIVQFLYIDKNYKVHKLDTYWDGKDITGRYVYVGTYTYETVPDEHGRTRIKTVPAYMPKDNFDNMCEDREFLIRLLDEVLSYNAMK